MTDVYLAGKVDAKKWDIAKQVTGNIRFVASDGGNHSAHEWGCYCVEQSIGTEQEFLRENVLKVIQSCAGMVAYFYEPTSFGSIAEIAYASTVGKQVRIILRIDPCPNAGDHWENCEQCEQCNLESRICDAYWFISNFPNVQCYESNSDEESVGLMQRYVNRFKYGNGREKDWVKMATDLRSKYDKGLYRAYMKSEAWNRKRKEAFGHYGEGCRQCGYSGCFSNPIQVHHVSYQTLYDEHMDDLLPLCLTCHQRLHEYYDSQEKQ